jgi:hypothetical protein
LPITSFQMLPIIARSPSPVIGQKTHNTSV